VFVEGQGGTLQLRTTTFLLGLAAACTGGGGPAERRLPERAMEQPSIEQVVATRTAELLRIEGVQGVGQALCDKEPCIRVYLRSADVAKLLPQRLDGYRVDGVVTGEFRAR